MSCLSRLSKHNVDIRRGKVCHCVGDVATDFTPTVTVLRNPVWDSSVMPAEEYGDFDRQVEESGSVWRGSKVFCEETSEVVGSTRSS